MEFCLRVKGTVTAGIKSGCAENNMASVGKYKYPQRLTLPGTKLRAYYESICPQVADIDNNYNKSIAFMQMLHERFIYEKNVTNVNTTAEEAWNTGKVCGRHNGGGRFKPWLD